MSRHYAILDVHGHSWGSLYVSPSDVQIVTGAYFLSITRQQAAELLGRARRNGSRISRVQKRRAA